MITFLEIIWIFENECTHFYITTTTTIKPTNLDPLQCREYEGEYDSEVVRLPGTPTGDTEVDEVRGEDDDEDDDDNFVEGTDASWTSIVSHHTQPFHCKHHEVDEMH